MSVTILDNKPSYLLTVNNPKTVKGEKRNWYTVVMYLAPAQISGKNVCSHSTVGCRLLCLNTAGKGGMGLDDAHPELHRIQRARIQRTRYFTRNQKGFMRDLAVEISEHQDRAIRKGMKFCVRLNGTSDLPWENIRCGKHRNIMAMFPDIQFYDYTKVPTRVLKPMPRNYHLTFSLAEDNDARAVIALELGNVNVAAVFDTESAWNALDRELPSTFKLGGVSYPVIDGDLTDLRFLDRKGVIVGLRAKGRARKDTTGFVRSGKAVTARQAESSPSTRIRFGIRLGRVSSRTCRRASSRSSTVASVSW